MKVSKWEHGRLSSARNLNLCDLYQEYSSTQAGPGLSQQRRVRWVQWFNIKRFGFSKYQKIHKEYLSYLSLAQAMLAQGSTWERARWCLQLCRNSVEMSASKEKQEKALIARIKAVQKKNPANRKCADCGDVGPREDGCDFWRAHRTPLIKAAKSMTFFATLLPQIIPNLQMLPVRNYEKILKVSWHLAKFSSKSVQKTTNLRNMKQNMRSLL